MTPENHENTAEGRRPPFDLAEPSPTPWFRFQEYWVDFLGSLLPGTLFAVGALVALVPAAVLLVNTIGLDFRTTFGSLVQSSLAAAAGTPNTIWLALMTALLGVSYALGHMFYRQDPKQPNARSFRLLADELAQREDRDCPSDEKLEDELKKEFACTSEDDCEFPFPYFDKYLENRGLSYLLPFIVWKDNREHRTKNYINILKVRLKFYFPNRCSTIIRNEAHVRLASSTWYVGGGLKLCALISLGVILVSGVICTAIYVVAPSSYPSLQHHGVVAALVARHVTAGIAAALVLFAAQYARTRVEKFLHYQRQREVVYVLETAWTAFQHHPYLLAPPFDEYPRAIAAADG